jgi:predicted DNA-binding transcriptional regulator AlpA
MARFLDSRRLAEKLEAELGHKPHPATIWRQEKLGRFPKRLRLFPNSRSLWVEDEIDAWLARKIVERDATIKAA